MASEDRAPNPMELRQQLLDAILRLVAVLGLPVLLVSVYASIVSDLAWLAVADGVLYLAALVLWRWRSLPYRTRAGGLLVLVGLIGDVVLIETGPNGAGFLWIAVLPVLAAALLDLPAGLRATASIVVTWLGLLGLHALGWVSWSVDGAVLLLTVQAANATVLGGLGATTVGILLRGIEAYQAERMGMVDRLRRKRQRLEEANRALEEEVAVRERVEADLVEASWKAGRAEVARDILHNVNNVVTSVVVQAEALRERLDGIEPRQASLAASLLEVHHDELGPYLTEDPRGRLLPRWLGRYGQDLEDRVRALDDGFEELGERLAHLRSVLATQQRHAGPGEVDEVAVATIVDAAAKLALPGAQGPGWTLDTMVDAQLRIRVHANLAVQVLVNLLINARNAVRGRSGGEGRIEVVAVPDGEGGARIAVTDDGVGLEPGQEERIFERGYSTQGTTGIGLSMSRSAAERMGGRLGVQSDGPDQGATFVLVLPEKPPEVPSPAPPAAASGMG